MSDIFFDEASFSSALLDTVGAIIVVLDVEGRILSINRTCEQLTGYTLAEVRGISLDHMLIEDELPGVKRAFDQLVKGEKRHNHQNHWITKNGDLKFIEWTNMSLKGKDGQVQYILGTGIDVTERNKKVKALRESEKRFALMFHSSSVPILIARAADWKIIDINPIFEKITGYVRQELIGVDLIENEMIEFDGKMSTVREQILNRSKEPVQYELKINNKSGQKLIMMASAVQIDLEGETCLLVSLQDVSEQKAYEQKILRWNDELERRVNDRTAALESQIQQKLVLQQKLNELMRINPVVIVSTLPVAPYTTTYISENIETIFGYRAEDMKNPSFRWRQIVHPDHVNKAPDVIRALETSNSVSNEFLLRRPDGVYRNVLHVATLIRDEHGNPIEIHFSMQDITEQREFEHEIREREELYRSLAESSRDFISVLAKDGTIVYVNRFGAQLFGLQPEEMVGKLRQEFFTSDQTNYPKEVLEKVFQDDQVVYFDENVKLPDSFSWFGTQMMPIHGKEGDVSAVLGISRDITARKQVESELKIALQKEKDLNELQVNFISMITHQFGTPLSTILSSAEMLEEYGGHWSNDRRSNHQQKIIASAKRINAMMQDILELNRTDVHADQINLQPVDLAALCSSVVESFQAADHSHHQFHFIGSSEPLVCRVDELLIVNSLENLLTNAMKYSAEGTSIELSLSVEGDRILIQIKDQGIGISKQDLAAVGTAFYRAKNVSRIPGTGLGLAFVKRSVQAMQGTFEIRSKEKAGTEVDLRLPYLPAVLDNENIGEVHEQDFGH